MDYVCGQGFKEVELKENGDITPCCPVWTHFYSFGNVFESEYEDIMNSGKAKEFRRSLINKTYKYCDTEKCVGKHPISEKELYELCKKDGTAIKYAENFSFGHDRCCNVLCVFCRDHNWMNTDEETARLDSLIDSHLLPLLKDTKNIKMLASGEVFASRHGRKLVKAITDAYPHIKFNLVSNGVLFDEKNCIELGIIDKLGRITISVHSATRETYNKLIRNGDFDRLWNNIQWLVSLKNENKIEALELVFTITHINYKEMILFAEKALSLGIEFKFFEYRKEEGEFSNHYEEASVWLPENKKHKEFLKIISNPIFDSPLCHMSGNINTLRTKMKNKNKFWKIFNLFKGNNR